MNFPTEQILRYSYQVSHSQSTLLDELEIETHLKTPNPDLLSGAFQGRVLSFLSKLVKPKKIIEIGTFTSFSSICLAEGLSENGQLHTIDTNEELVPLQDKYLRRAGLENIIIRHLGDAKEIIPKIKGPIDLAFIDADKQRYPIYFNLILPKMRRNGLIISDNTLWKGKVLGKSGDEDTNALKEYNLHLRSSPKVQTILLPFRDGLTLSLVL